MNYYDNNGLIICQICEKSYHFITSNHLRKQHDISTKEYREMYPEVPMAKKDYYKTLKDKKGTKKHTEEKIIFEHGIEELNLNEPFKEKIIFEPRIEELNLNEPFIDDNKSFKENKSIVELANKKVSVPERSFDPMDDKIRIIAYLRISFPKIRDNYMFKKKRSDGSIECQFITDMADPSCKTVFDFPNAFWHNEQMCVSPHIRNQMLKSYGWNVIIINSPMPKVSHVELKLKDKFVD